MNLRIEHIDPEKLAAYLSGNLPPEELSRVEEWIRASEANRQEYEAYLALWLHSGPKPDTEAALNKVMHRIDLYESEHRLRPWPAWLSMSLRVAAILLPLVLIGYLLLYRVQDPAPQYLSTTESPLEQSLPDGSFLHLNAHSVVSYPAGLSGDQREVHLEGEAFFKVSKDPGRPFIVKSNELYVIVIGTQFNVSAYPDKDTIRVSVEEGMVGLYVTSETDIQDSLLLSAGEEGLYLRSEEKLLFHTRFNPNLLFWKHKTLSFDKTPLREVLAQMSKAFGQRIILDDPRTGDLRLTATFENASPEQMMDVLAETFRLTWERNDTSFVIYAQDTLSQ